MFVRLQRKGISYTLVPLVGPGDGIQADQIIASVVPVAREWSCPDGADTQQYIHLATSTSLSDRYAAVKALGRFDDPASSAALLQRLHDTREHVYVRVDAAAGLMRRDDPAGAAFLSSLLQDSYLENRLEAVIVLGERRVHDVTVPRVAISYIG